MNQLAATDPALALPLSGRQLIQASAGTGKTFTIAGLYARLVVEEGVEVRNILVMTFTNAACDELRQRLRARLELCAALASDPRVTLPPEALAEAATAEDGEQRIALELLHRALPRHGGDPAALATRIRSAISRMDEAVIVTIHGFCQRVLRDHAARVGAGVDEVLEPSDADLLEDFVADFRLRTGARHGTEGLLALEALASQRTSLPELTRQLIAFTGELLPEVPEALPPLPDMPAADAALVAAWAAGGARACATFREWYADGRLNKNTYNDKTEERLVALDAALRAGDIPDAEALERFSQANISGKVKKPEQKKHGDFPEEPAFAAIDAWLVAHQAREAHRQALSVQLLHQLRREGRARLRTRKQELRRQSFDDLIARLHEALEGAAGAALAESLQRQYPYAMVDEFQDTSARQWEILDRIYAGGGWLCMIGDPKQAIYAFRGGDVHTYLRAARTATGRIWDLEDNYRSAQPLLDAVEALFTQRQQPFIAAGIDFHPVRSGLAAGQVRQIEIGGEPVAPLTLWPLPQGDKDTREAALARAAACEIAGLLDGRRTRLLDPAAEKDADRSRHVRPADIGVLVNSNREAERMLDALRRERIPAVAAQRRSIFATEDAAELLRVLDALLTPESLRLARGALATVLLGRGLDELHGGADGSVPDADLERLDDLRAVWRRHGVLALVERLLEARVAALLARPDGERRATNLLHLGELAEAEARRRSGARALRDWLARRVGMAADGVQAREEEELRLESDADCVQVMTLHKSKGLEFNLVLIPFMGLHDVRAPEKGTLASFHAGDTGVKRLITTVSKGRAGEDADAVEAARHEALAEQVRLLYVGVTRARCACWLGVGADPDPGEKDQEDKDKPAKSALAWLLPGDPGGAALAAAHGGRIVRAEPPEAPQGTPDREPAPASGPARRFTRPVAADWWVHSFSQLNRGEREHEFDAPADRDEGAAAEAAPEPGDAGEFAGEPRGPEFGTAVHAILEHADFCAWRPGAELPQTEQALLERELVAAGFAGAALLAARGAARRMIAASLVAPCLEDGTRLADLAPGDRRAEMRFHFGIAGAAQEALLQQLHVHDYQRGRHGFGNLRGRLRGLMHGIIDLVFRHGGQWWVVDYKTNHLGDRGADYGAAGMQAEVERAGYDLQYLIYTLAVHRWLRQVLGVHYDYARDFGGVRYLFLRGMDAAHPGRGVFADRPPAELILALDRLLAAPGQEAA